MKLSAERKLALAAAATLVALGCSGLAKAEVPSWCGPKKATIALLDGYGGNSWRQGSTASGKGEGLKCPSITAHGDTNGQGETQKSAPAIQSTSANAIDRIGEF